jgi:lipocalin
LGPGCRYSSCVTAQYTIKDQRNIDVYNRAYENGPNGVLHEANLCAVLDDPSLPGQLKVGPCFLPAMLYGPYWIVEYDEVAGFALISGGQPSIPSGSGLCKTGNGVNNAGA